MSIINEFAHPAYINDNAYGQVWEFVRNEEERLVAAGAGDAYIRDVITAGLARMQQTIDVFVHTVAHPAHHTGGTS